MTGILQIFDRQHIGQNHRRLLPPPPGNSQFSNANFDADSSNPYRRQTVVIFPSFGERYIPTVLFRSIYEEVRNQWK